MRVPIEISIVVTIIVKWSDHIEFKDSLRIQRLSFSISYESEWVHRVWKWPNINGCEVGRVDFFLSRFGKLVSPLAKAASSNGCAARALCIRVSFASPVFFFFSFLRETVMATNNYKTQRASGTYHWLHEYTTCASNVLTQLSPSQRFPTECSAPEPNRNPPKSYLHLRTTGSVKGEEKNVVLSKAKSATKFLHVRCSKRTFSGLWVTIKNPLMNTQLDRTFFFRHLRCCSKAAWEACHFTCIRLARATS